MHGLQMRHKVAKHLTINSGKDKITWTVMSSKEISVLDKKMKVLEQTAIKVGISS